MSSTFGPPVIDLAPLLSNEKSNDINETILQIASACKQWGFFQCTNHGIPTDILHDFDEQTRMFFKLPIAVKQSIKRSASNSRGWFDDELTKRKRDWKECIDLGVEGKSVDGCNQWPDENVLPNFRPAFEAYFKHCWSLSRTLLNACALGLGVPGNTFDEVAEPHSSYLRVNYYPICDQKIAPSDHPLTEPDPDIEGNLCINKHTDAGCLTVLRQYASEPASLQVYRDAKWHHVVPVKDALTINIGDMMQVWSNGEYTAPLHRVLANAEKERFSAPFFYNPSYSSIIQPVTTTSPPRYKPLSWAEFRQARFKGDFGDYGEEVQIKMWAVEETEAS